MLIFVVVVAIFYSSKFQFCFVGATGEKKAYFCWMLMVGLDCAGGELLNCWKWPLYCLLPGGSV